MSLSRQGLNFATLASLLQYFALAWLASNNMISALSIWSCLKLLTVFRLVGGIKRNFFSTKSAYIEEDATPVSAALSPAVLAGGTISLSTGTGSISTGKPKIVAAPPQPAPVSSMDADCGAEPEGPVDIDKPLVLPGGSAQS